MGFARVPVCSCAHGSGLCPCARVPVCPCARGSGLCPCARVPVDRGCARVPGPATSPEVQKWHAGGQLQLQAVRPLWLVLMVDVKAHAWSTSSFSSPLTSSFATSSSAESWSSTGCPATLLFLSSPFSINIPPQHHHLPPSPCHDLRPFHPPLQSSSSSTKQRHAEQTLFHSVFFVFRVWTLFQSAFSDQSTWMPRIASLQPPCLYRGTASLKTSNAIIPWNSVDSGTSHGYHAPT